MPSTALMAGTRRRNGTTTPAPPSARGTSVAHSVSAGETRDAGSSGAAVKPSSAVPIPEAGASLPSPIQIHLGVRGLLDLAAVAALVAPLLHMYSRVQSTAVQASLTWSVLIAVAVFGTTVALIPTFGAHTRKAGLWGKDLCKKGTARQDVKVYVADCLGSVCVQCVQTVCGAVLGMCVVCYGRKRALLQVVAGCAVVAGSRPLRMPARYAGRRRWGW